MSYMRRKNTVAITAKDGIASLSLVLPEVQKREYYQCTEFSNRNYRSARRKDTVLTAVYAVVHCAFFRRKIMKKTLVQKMGLLGVVSFLSYTAAVIFAPLAYPGYNWMMQAVSDLSAANAPSLALWNRLSAFYNVCEVVCATVVCIGIQGQKTKLLRSGIYLFAVMEWISDVGYRMFPLSSSGYAGTFQDIMHMVTTVAVVLLSIVSLVLIIIAGVKSKSCRSYGICAVIALFMMLVGAMGMKIVPTDYFGFIERFSVFAATGFNAALGIHLFCINPKENKENKELINMSIIPYVVEQTGHGERNFDIFSRLLSDRIIFLGEEVTDTSAGSIIAQMLFLEAQDSDRDIQLYINSPGGSVSAGFAIYDTMQYIKCDVSTICIGLAASFGAFLLAGGAKGKRIELPNAEIMIHQPFIGGNVVRGPVTDIQIVTEQMLKTKRRLTRILSENTGRSITEIAADTERDNYMSAREALAYGLIDKIIEKR